ncbi:MAG TPA: glycosyltransferase family 4 protein [Candidatus Paceibacterota bacterium]|nr:glycosyltransferase family 4 protein [Candidatus Paceibacterota bacterium]
MTPRVLMYGWEFPPHNSGGLGTACLGLTRALANRGVDVTFVLPKELSIGAPFLKVAYADVKADLLAVPSALYPYATAEGYAQTADSSGLYGATLIDEVRRYGQAAGAIARSEPHDVIHAHDWLSFPAGMAARAVSGRPLVAHVHATEFDRTGGRGVNEEVYAIEREGMEAADRIVAVSGRTKEMIGYHYGISESKIEAIHNGIDAEGADQGLPERIHALKLAGFKFVLFVGRITLQKGPDYFIRLAKEIIEREPKTYCIVAGSGDMQGQIMQQAATYGIFDRVLFSGFARGAELAALYRWADVYVLPSVSEPFGITPLEAALHGTPVVVSKQSGVAEVLEHSIKVDFWDVELMAEEVVRILRNEEDRDALIKGAREDLKSLTWDKAAGRCLDLYRSLLRPVTL